MNEIGEYQGEKNGAVSAFRIDRKSGHLALLNQVPTLGANPAYITVSRNGKFVLFASYYGGVVVRPIHDDGSIGNPTAAVQMGVPPGAPHPEDSHPHAVVLAPDERFAMVPDLGLNRIFVFRFDENSGILTPNDPPYWQSKIGVGPRHFAFAPNGRFAYASNEMQSTLSALTYDARAGALHHVDTVSTLPANYKEANTGAEVAVAPSGKFVYASNRGHNSIAVFAIDGNTGFPTLVQDVPTQGKTPRNFAIDPSGSFMLVGNQDSSEIIEFRIDSSTGRLEPAGQKVEIAFPVCILFVPVR